MTLLFIESFDHHGTTNASIVEAAERKWGSVTDLITTIETGRFGVGSAYGMGHSFNNLITPRFSDGDELIVGFAINRVSGAPGILQFRDSGTAQGALSFDAGGVVHYFRGNFSAELTRGITNFRSDKWFYVELRLKVDNSAGEVEMKINGVEEFSETSIDTDQTGSGVINEIAFISTSNTRHDLDDIYVSDTNGSVNIGFLGERKVEVLFADGAGANTDWTPSAGSNFENVDENPADDDTTYNSTTTTSDTDSFTFDDLSEISQDISGVQVNVLQRKEDVGSRGLAAITISGATTDVGATKFVTDEYQYNSELLELDPNTSAQWAVAAVNAAEYGYRLIS